MLAMIAPYREEMAEEMNEVIGHNAQMLTKEKPEGSLNNWLVDVMKAEAESYSGTSVDFAASNYGGIRVNSLGEGPVTVGRIYEVMPFDNLLVILEAKGEVLKTFFDDMADEGGWPVSKEVNLTIADGTATEILINGRPLFPEQVYHFVVSDFVANGGDNRTYLKDLPRQTLNYLVRDALINNVRDLAQQGNSIVAVKDGRVKVVSSD